MIFLVIKVILAAQYKYILLFAPDFGSNMGWHRQQ